MLIKSLAKLTFGAIAMVGTMVALPLTPAAHAQDAQQQAPVILIVDQARIIAQSKAGNSIAEQMKTLQDTANKELERQIAAVVEEAEGLQAKKDDLPEEEYLQKAQQIAIKQNNLPVLREVKVRELSASEQKAIEVIGEEMRPILKEIVDARGATLLLDRSAVMYANSATDITDEVMAKLDEKLPTVKVERVRLAQKADQ